MKFPLSFRVKRSLGLATFAFTLFFLSTPTVRAIPVVEDVLDAATRKTIFERVWSRINERFFDPKFHGVNWKAMHDRYAPEAAAATSNEVFYQVLERMLGELKQSHIGIIPPEAYSADEKSSDKADDGDGTAGLTIQWIENQLVITQVEAGSGAETAGLRPGFVVTAIGDKKADDLVERLRKRVKSPGELATVVRLHLADLCNGPVETPLTLSYRDTDDQPQTATIKRKPPTGKIVRFGELPPLRVEVEQKRLPGGFGYIRANIFMMPILPPIREAVASFVRAPGIILDLRGNPGGMGVLAGGVAGSFFSKTANLGTMTMRQGNINFLAYPQPVHYAGPLVILTDEGSASTSELLAGGLQELGRAVVIGQPTAGMVLPSVVEVLPGGARFQYAFADYRTPKGILLEGRGVKPNIPVILTRKSLLAGKDPALEAAVNYLKSRQGANSGK